MIRDSSRFRGICRGLCALLLAPAAALPGEIDQARLPQRLEVVVVQGEGAINDVRQRVARDTVVEVRDESGRPVKNASVSFTVPVSGASGELSNGSTSMTVLSDAGGQAVLRGLKPRNSGKMPIQVNASYRGVAARAVVTQFNMEVPGTRKRGGAGKTIAILAIGAAAAAGGVMLGTNRSRNPTAAAAPLPPIGIATGTGSVSGPR
jgi:hypothetical protein